MAWILASMVVWILYPSLAGIVVRSRVESAFYVWVNGEQVGYSEDSYTAAEFDISKYLKRLLPQVLRFDTVHPDRKSVV